MAWLAADINEVRTNLNDKNLIILKLQDFEKTRLWDFKTISTETFVDKLEEQGKLTGTIY